MVRVNVKNLDGTIAVTHVCKLDLDCYKMTPDYVHGSDPTYEYPFTMPFPIGQETRNADGRCPDFQQETFSLSPPERAFLLIMLSVAIAHLLMLWGN